MSARRRWHLGAGCAVLFLVVGVAVGAPGVAAQEAESTVWVVRHAERADGGAASTPDPELSAEGQARAAALARLLGEAGITTVHSTDYRRSRDTVTPLARILGVEVELYDPRDRTSMAALETALRSPGRHLVVGHSNTVPPLVERLGGDAGEPMPETEFDRLYLLRLDGAQVETTILRFGAPEGGER